MILERKGKIIEQVKVSEPGDRPAFEERVVKEFYLKDRTVGVTRYYQSMQAGKRVDRLIRVWLDRDFTIGQKIRIDDSPEAYSIDQIQYTFNDDGLPVMDLTLEVVKHGT